MVSKTIVLGSNPSIPAKYSIIIIMGEYDAPRGRHIERSRQVGLIVSGLNRVVQVELVEPNAYHPAQHDIDDTQEGFDIDGNYHRIKGVTALVAEVEYEHPEI